MLAEPEAPSRRMAAFTVLSMGRWNQLESPLDREPCQAVMAFVLPEFKTSNTSSSPQPDFQQEQSPYCWARGISALSSQMAGISALKPVFPERGMENSTRNNLESPLKPSGRRISGDLQRGTKSSLTVSNRAVSDGATASGARFVGEDDNLLVVINQGVGKGDGRGGTRFGFGTSIRKRVAPSTGHGC